MSSIKKIKKMFHSNWIETDNFTNYKWTLYNFSSCTGDIIRSPIFSNCVSDFKNNLQWQLNLFLDGENESRKGWVEIFLCSKNDFEVRVDWELTMSCSTRTYKTQKMYDELFHGIEYSRSFSDIKRVTLLNDLKKGDDRLIVNLKMLFSKNPTNVQSNLIRDLKLLSEMEKISDVILISKDGREHKVHKAILICRSKVFLAMFQHDMQESQNNVVRIQDVDGDILSALLHFIYTAEVKNLQDIAEKLFIAADKYDLDDLKKLCVYHLCENIENDNVFDLIEFSHIYGIYKLENVAKNYFLKNHKEIMLMKGRDSMKNLSRNIIAELLYSLAVQEEASESSSDFS